MARKLYIFGIGGTGSRVIKALTMLFAAGVRLQNDFNVVIPIIIDPDISNGDLKRTKEILRLYQEIRYQVEKPDDFYRQEITTLNELVKNSPSVNEDYFHFQLDGVNNSKFKDYIGFDRMNIDYEKSKDDKNLVRLLYSENNLDSNLSVGFKGNPNMGSIVLNQFTSSGDFKKFGQTFQPDDAIFIINSIFGGTGAAGFPLLLNNLRGNEDLPNHLYIKDAPIGGITYLPYFTLPDENEINAKSFEEKSKIAIDYYNRTIINQKKINVLHFIGNRGNTNYEDFATGGEKQKNKAHFLEIAGALAIVEFCETIGNYYFKKENTDSDTLIKEFGIERDNENITFDDLNLKNKDLIFKPLMKFRLYSQFLKKYPDLKEDLEKALNVSRWTKSNIWFVPNHKQSPLDKDYFLDSKYKNKIAKFNNYFTEWITELAGNKPAFWPFQEKVPATLFRKIDTQNCLLIDKNDFRSETKNHTTLIKIFGRSTEKTYKKLPLNKTAEVSSKIKVFRLHKGKDGTGWFTSQAFDKDNLDTIKTAGKDIATSIPSPFARIDLVKSAFKWVTDNGIEGKTAQHKLVSETLDVAQLFYNYPLHKDRIAITSWKPDERFTDLINGSDKSHSEFAQTLKIFWEQDSLPLDKSDDKKDSVPLYNFELVDKLYLLIYRNNGLVIGGTSPATLFFASPDAKKALTEKNENDEDVFIKIACGNHVLFGDKYTPLNKREESFIEYIYSVAKQNPEFALRFPEVFAYLDKVRLISLKSTIQKKVTSLTKTSILQYPVCPVLDDSNVACEVIDYRLGIKGIDKTIIENGSDFVIRSDFENFDEVWDINEKKYNKNLIFPDKTINEARPLVLPDSRFNSPWTYTTTGIKWDENTAVPSRNPDSPGDSRLPVQEDNYYWLSKGNFLEDKIIELPYKIDNIKFKTCGTENHLLPLTDTFFKYFRTENVNKYLKLNTNTDGSIEAALTIPVKNGEISFRKKYQKNDIIIIDFHLAIMPFVKTSYTKINYTLALLDARSNKNNNIEFDGLNKGSHLKLREPIVRSKGEQNTIKSIYYKINENFDSLRIKNNECSGFIIPNFPEKNGNQKLFFAIDFGTTNTHIEYKYGLNTERALDNTYDISLWQPLYDYKEDESKIGGAVDYFEKEIFPFLFNEDSVYKFPFRTALTTNTDLDHSKPLEVFGHTNSFLLFEKRFYPDYLSLHTRLKWSNYDKTEDKKLVESYIECLMSMVLYKTLLLDGNPDETRITWFYPVSMDHFEQTVFFATWNNAYHKVFGNSLRSQSLTTDNNVTADNRIIAIPESIAPYLYYRARYPGLSLTIDIGGGSSDIALFEKEDTIPKFISSFKFAGNAIFGDGFQSDAFRNSSDNNGFVRSFLDEATKCIKKGTQQDIILNDILNLRKDSSDFSSFLFSLESEPGMNFSYTRLLQDNRMMKLPILVFYAAIIYYSASLLKKYKISEIPKNILLSGTASKTVSIIDPTQTRQNVAKLFRHILESTIQSN